MSSSIFNFNNYGSAATLNDADIVAQMKTKKDVALFLERFPAGSLLRITMAFNLPVFKLKGVTAPLVKGDILFLMSATVEIGYTAGSNIRYYLSRVLLLEPSTNRVCVLETGDLSWYYKAFEVVKS